MAGQTKSDTGFLLRAVRVADRSYRYAVFVPPDYTPKRIWPCLLFLHGMGERGDDGQSHTRVGIGKAIRQHPERFDCLVVMPHCPTDRLWDETLQPVALACLEATQADYRVDPDRIVLTGLSMGGYGTWSLGATETHRFAALVPICGGGEPQHAESLARLPIWCFHGSDDPVVIAQRSRDMVAAVREAGGSVTFSEYPRVGHNCWDLAYGDPAVIAWMMSQHRRR